MSEITIGSTAPSFTLEGTDGAVTLSEVWKQKTFVLYFYPKDDTPG
jgi:peroxiredoxin